MNSVTADNVSIADLEDHPWINLDGEDVQADVFYIDETLGGWVCEFGSLEVFPLNECFANPDNIPEE